MSSGAIVYLSIAVVVTSRKIQIRLRKQLLTVRIVKPEVVCP